jgi:hypothetical protein
MKSKYNVKNIITCHINKLKQQDIQAQKIFIHVEITTKLLNILENKQILLGMKAFSTNYCLKSSWHRINKAGRHFLAYLISFLLQVFNEHLS